MKVTCIDNKNRDDSTEDVPSLLTEGKEYIVKTVGIAKNSKKEEVIAYELEGFEETRLFIYDRFEIISHGEPDLLESVAIGLIKDFKAK